MRSVSVLFAVLVSLLSMPALPAAQATGVAGEWHVALPSDSDDWPLKSAAVDIGDMDGDGLHDVGVVADNETAWINFAPESLPEDTVGGQSGWRGFKIVGDFSVSHRIAGLGDVNGDGRREVMLVHEGRVTVVFGRTDGATVDLAHLGSDGFQLLVRTDGAGFGDAGDQNGDGRSDIAYATGGGIGVAFTPAHPAGAVIGQDDAKLVTGPDDRSPLYIGTLGDLDGDGRDDLAAAIIDGEAGGTVVGFASPGPGAEVHLDDAVAAGRAFVLTAPDHYVNSAATVADRNGDGRRDIAMTTFSLDASPKSSLVIAFSPVFGTRRTVLPAVPGQSTAVPGEGQDIVAVEDIDGDQRPEVASYGRIYLSGNDLLTSEAPVIPGPVTCNQLTFGAGQACGVSRLQPSIGGALPDRNGDGLGELVVAGYASSAAESDGYVHLNVRLSAPTPDIEAIGQPIFGRGSGQGSFAVPVAFRTGDISALTNYQPAVTLFVGPPGGPLLAAGEDRNVVIEGGVGRVTPMVTWAYSQPYEAPLDYRVAVSTGRGAVTLSPVLHSTYPPSPVAVAEALLRLRGTNHRDRLVGTRRRDELIGRRGDDLLIGKAGRDRLFGGVGRDRLRGGPGVDVLDCGPGAHDVAFAGHHDRVRHCERVVRAG